MPRTYLKCAINLIYIRRTLTFYIAKLDGRFSQLMIFAHWGRFFFFPPWHNEVSLFLFDSRPKTEEGDIALFPIFSSKAEIFIFYCDLMGSFCHVSPCDAHQKSIKRNLRKSPMSVASFKCFLRSKITLRATDSRKRAKNLPQWTLLF